MTRNASTPTGDKSRKNRPAYFAYHVRDLNGGPSLFTKVGVAFQHKDGKGFNLLLEIVPLNGQITLREPLETK